MNKDMSRDGTTFSFLKLSVPGGVEMPEPTAAEELLRGLVLLTVPVDDDDPVRCVTRAEGFGQTYGLPL